MLRLQEVLVVDDNDMNLKVAKNLLKLFGIVPDLADSGFEAIELMRKEHYNVVFLDHMMPKMDGVETLRLLKKEQLIPDDTKMIVLTANAVLGAKEQYLKDGFDDYLSKPIDVGKLEELLIRTLPKELYTLKTEEEKAGEPAESENSAVNDLQKAGFDTAAGLRFAAGDRDFYLELASGFAEGAAKNLPQIRADFEEAGLGELPDPRPRPQEHRPADRRKRAVRACAAAGDGGKGAEHSGD